MNAIHLVSIDEITQAASRIQGVARLTPLLHAPTPAVPRLFLKCENLQPAGAFKIRGAYNMIAQVDSAALKRGVITYSSGNHGQAVAFAARLLGAPAVIVMPTTAPAVKVEGARSFGAEVIFEGTTSIERKRRAEQEAEARGLTMVPPFDHRRIVAGAGTAGLEILSQALDLRTVVVQIGGGGLVSGVATAVKSMRPDVRVIGVEPVGAAKMKTSIAAGHPVTLDKTTGIADGLMPVRPGDITFEHVRAYVDEIVTVDDDAIIDAVVWLFRQVKLVVEPSGAAAVAAILSGGVRDIAQDGSTVAILSGGNMALETLADLDGRR